MSARSVLVIAPTCGVRPASRGVGVGLTAALGELDREGIVLMVLMFIDACQ